MENHLSSGFSMVLMQYFKIICNLQAAQVLHLRYDLSFDLLEYFILYCFSCHA